MKVLGLIEVHPFDGTEPFVCLRLDNKGNLFDLPIDQEQLGIIMQNTQGHSDTPNEYEEEYEKESVEQHTEQPEPTGYVPSPVRPQASTDDTLYINTPPQDMDYSEYSMAESSLWDDDL